MIRYFDNRQYIFCINSGRSGSDYLAKVLDTAAEVKAFHEPAPEMTGPFLRMVTTDTYRHSFSRRKFKVRAIRKLAGSVHAKVYAETSHMFIKTYFDVAVHGLKHVRVIFLKRNIFDTLCSFYELGYFSDWESSWKDWMISPFAKTSAIDAFITGEVQDQVSLAIAYLIDIRARGARFKSEFPRVPVYEIGLYDLNRKEEVEKLFRWLHITPTEETWNIVGRKKNDRVELKQKIGGHVPDKSYLKQRYLEHIQKLLSAGIAVPADVLAEVELLKQS